MTTIARKAAEEIANLIAVGIEWGADPEIERQNVTAIIQDAINASYAAGRADQRKADVEIARRLKAWVEASKLHTKDPWETDRADAKVQAAESIAKAIEEQGKDPSP